MKIIKPIIKRLFIEFIIPFKFRNNKIYSFIPLNTKLGKGTIIKENCIIGKNIEIGDYTFINNDVRIDSNTKSIGKYCSISHNVKIGLASHSLRFISSSPVFYSKHRGIINIVKYDEYKDQGYTTVGNDVWIGANAIILAGINVGDGCVIGAGSIITRDIPPYSIVTGIPGTVKKYRFSEDLIRRMLEIKWWDYDISIISKFEKYFDSPNEFLDCIEKLKK